MIILSSDAAICHSLIYLDPVESYVERTFWRLSRWNRALLRWCENCKGLFDSGFRPLDGRTSWAPSGLRPTFWTLILGVLTERLSLEQCIVEIRRKTKDETSLADCLDIRQEEDIIRRKANFVANF